MRLKSASFVFSAIVAVALVGCQSASEPLVGTWTAEMDIGGMKGPMEATYRADKTFSSSGSIKNELMEVSMTQTGTWERVDGDKVKLTLTDLTMTAGGPSASQLQPMLDGQKATMMKQINDSAPAPVTFEGNDKMTQTMEGQTLVFTRKE